MSFMGSSSGYCSNLPKNSIYSLLHREGERLFPDDAFTDLFAQTGRPGVPPHIVAIVMVLQRAEGLSDRDAVERFAYDLRWKYAAGGLEVDYPRFVHTVLVDMRARLRRSKRPDRIFEAVLDVCKKAGLVGRKRAFDSTPLYDAVATQDTVTLIRSAIRSLLRVAKTKPALREEIVGVLKRDDDYLSPGKPNCAWDDEDARLALVDALAKDALAIVELLEARPSLSKDISEATELLATLVGQDLEQSEDGSYFIKRGVAKDRVISVVDPEARHGHKTEHRSFDGFKGHISIDTDSEIIVASDVTPGNVGDGEGADALLEEVVAAAKDKESKSEFQVFGDAAYGTADIVEKLEDAGIEPMVRVQTPTNRDENFTKNDFDIDMKARKVRCPNGVTVHFKFTEQGGLAQFGKHCAACPRRADCTSSKRGRLIRIHPKEELLQRTRLAQSKQSWKDAYRSTRPKVERKIAHLMRHRHGGRRARVRGTTRIRDDFSLLCATQNLKRLAQYQMQWCNSAWRVIAALCALLQTLRIEEKRCFASLKLHKSLASMSRKFNILRPTLRRVDTIEALTPVS